MVSDLLDLMLGITHVSMSSSSAVSSLQEALYEDEGESGSVPLSRPHEHQPKATRQGT